MQCLEIVVTQILHNREIIQMSQEFSFKSEITWGVFFISYLVL